MTQQNGPNRPRTNFGYGRRADGSMNWLPLALGVAAVVVLVMMFMPSRDTTRPRMTETSPQVDRPAPATPPSTAPATPTQK